MEVYIDINSNINVQEKTNIITKLIEKIVGRISK